MNSDLAYPQVRQCINVGEPCAETSDVVVVQIKPSHHLLKVCIKS